ncbi:SMI1/KNR4 family protein [Fodinibius halophilus]|uniref:SMI1/KNR4 family protein n=1 Tax=Fodinibius halophilus TaxID=1736908 RepID=A0A6M1T6L4_9BACT|nr:SMI1/KNR4 family protein [Fodinibius halophilus]NGP88263.1 SMI1/KNR4 family protein [Fodinibius halophilus]
MSNIFNDFDLSSFWDECEYALSTYRLEEADEATISEVETKLSYKLPDSYIELMQYKNGGIPCNTAFPTQESTTWATSHVAIAGIMGIGSSKSYSLCGSMGSQFMIDEWGYPNIGIYFGNCPSAGHDMIALDYRKCGLSGIPQVVHVAQVSDYKITFLAHTFEEFVKGLVPDHVFD